MGIFFGAFGLLVVVAIVDWVLQIRRDRSSHWNKYLRGLPSSHRKLLANGVYSLKYPFEVKIVFHPTQPGRNIREIKDEKSLLFLGELGGFNRDHWQEPNFPYTLDGPASQLSWSGQSQNHLGWIQKTILAWQSLGRAREWAEKDPVRLFGAPYWPRMTKRLLYYFYNRIDYSRLDFATLEPILQKAPKDQRTVLAMSLWPPGFGWEPAESLFYLHQIHHSFLSKVLNDLGMDLLLAKRRYFWSQILKMRMGGEAQRQVLLWLQDHPELVVRDLLMSYGLFLHHETSYPALALLRAYPDAQTRDFLRQLPRSLETQELLVNLDQRFLKDDGCLSVEESDDDLGALSELQTHSSGSRQDLEEDRQTTEKTPERTDE
jgi:hypothetical protein